eukprot:TRINITY_DN11910_c0_g1_i1.p1 TRINITY_DN11910_c0_g1~~TRINITY_DN11910_c0_g1_i1.p1  ORF type:complete len:227 (-),score=86.72 TRINITY_DN11910_c0_g1_i1:10-615(-)
MTTVKKKEVVLSNWDSWSNLDEDEPKQKKETVIETATSNAQQTPGDGQLWKQFRSRDIQNKQREKEREEQEEILRRERELKEEERKKEELRRKKEQEELEAKRKLEEREAEMDAIKRRELERQRAKEAREKQITTVNMNEQSLVMASFEENILDSAPNLELSEIAKLKKAFFKSEEKTSGEFDDLEPVSYTHLTLPTICSV